MKPGLRVIICILFVFSACMLRADSVLFPDVFIEQRVKVFGLAGTPWEDNVAFDEERSRAWMDALHHCYEQILNLPLMEGRLVRHVMQINTGLKQRLGMILLSAKKKFYQADETGIIRCSLEMPLSGKLSLRSALYLAALRPQSHQPADFLASWSKSLVNNSLSDLPEPEYKRLVIDLRDFYFQPSLFPRFFSQKGELIFQEAMIPQPERFSRPAVLFMTDITEARKELKESEVYLIEAQVDEMATSDITIKDCDLEILTAFSRLLVQEADENRDIVIVFEPEKQLSAGKLKKTQSAEKEKAIAK